MAVAKAAPGALCTASPARDSGASARRVCVQAIFVFVWQATPSADSSLFYFYTNELHFGPEFLGRVRTAGSVASLAGIVLYNTTLKRVKLKRMFRWSAILGAGLGLTQVVLVTGWNERLGISNEYFCLVDEIILTVLGRISFMPVLVLAAKVRRRVRPPSPRPPLLCCGFVAQYHRIHLRKHAESCTMDGQGRAHALAVRASGSTAAARAQVCPEGVEATLFATLMSILNGGSVTGSFLGSLLTRAFGVTGSQFDNLALLLTTCSLGSLLPLPLLRLVPDLHDDDDSGGGGGEDEDDKSR